MSSMLRYLTIAILGILGITVLMVISLHSDETGEFELEHANYVNDAVFNMNGDQLLSASGGNCGLYVWHVSTRQLQNVADICPGNSQWGLQSVDWSNTSEHIVATRVNSTDIWIIDSSTFTIIRSLVGHTAEVRGAIFSHDGNSILSFDASGAVKMWDTSTYQLRLDFVGHTDIIASAVYSQDDQQIATASFDGTARLWNTQTGEVLQTLAENNNSVFTVAFSTDTQYLVSGGSDSVVRVWDTSTGLEHLKFMNSAWIMMSDFWFDNSSILFSEWLTGEVKLWIITDNQVVNQFNAGLESRIVAVNPFSEVVATVVENVIKIWEVHS